MQWMVTELSFEGLNAAQAGKAAGKLKKNPSSRAKAKDDPNIQKEGKENTSHSGKLQIIFINMCFLWGKSVAIKNDPQKRDVVGTKIRGE